MSWPWKKKSPPDKQAAEALNHVDELAKESEGLKYVQVSVESYTHLTGLEEQIKNYEDKVQALEDDVQELNERISEANSEMSSKDSLVKQHSKVAEEAISGWEKADAEAADLRNHLESVTLLKLTAEDRASHLDEALKECMRQIRNMKEEHDQKLQEVALSKAKLLDKMKLELEEKLFNLDQELRRAAAENSALSRSLKERSNMIIQLSEEKSQAEAEIEILKSNLEECCKEVNALKYELHIARKDAEIRNGEKNMSLRSAEVANKQHLEGVKKIAKLEGECQRLRGLVRKKLPGPAAVALMKLEVENLTRDGDSRLRRYPGKYPSQAPEFSLENSIKCIKENELLTERLMAMEEESKMLKGALSKSNSEFQAAQSIYALTASKLRSLEAELETNGEQLHHLKSTQNGSFFSKKATNQRSLPSLSEEGLDDNASSGSSWSTGLTSELSHIKREQNVGSSPRKSSNLDLMDDFLEMERFAYSTNESNGTVSDAHVQDSRAGVLADLVKSEGSAEVVTTSGSQFTEQAGRSPVENTRWIFSQPQGDPSVLVELQSLISTESVREAGENDQTVNIEVIHRTPVDQELKSAVDQVFEFILSIGREAKMVPDGSNLDVASLNANIDCISSKYLDTATINPVEFVLDISHVCSEARKLQLDVLGFKRSESESLSTVCIDKTDLEESKGVVDSLGSGNCFEQLKSDKENLGGDLARCMENFESTKLQLKEAENLLADVKSQLSSSQKSNSLADTQLKCMAESYKSLETRAERLQTEVNRLQGRADTLENELQEARISHHEALGRCKDLQDQLERVDASAAAGNDHKTCQEKELAAASEKLAECQETIYLLGKQLKWMVTQPETNNGRTPGSETPTEEWITNGKTESFDGDSGAGLESPSADALNAPFRPDYEMNNLLFSPGRSNLCYSSKSSSSSSSTRLPEKQARGISRFFSSSTTKGRLIQQ